MMVVFNTETQRWEPDTEPDTETRRNTIGTALPCHAVVMGDKIYTRNSQNSFVYEPKESKWQKDKMLNSKKWTNACVVDGVLYYHDRDEDSYEEVLRTYDPKKRCWGVVNGLEDFPAEMRWSSETVSYGGKLALFFLN
ncbi:unnamed protein product [Microthlaspi erraticum]|uniref:FKB95-like N-terminal Kelch domain-containing protein n=1 Tax=Microthlaspi erraticum TaxID=1685480 RepID=A0A6D2JDZ8_9BRAS|nr:unnamed protein product [Microthlaspi erraticum]